MLRPLKQKSTTNPQPKFISSNTPKLIPSTGVFSSSDLEREGQLIELGGYDFATQESPSSKIQKYRPVDAKEKLAKFIDDGANFSFIWKRYSNYLKTC